MPDHLRPSGTYSTPRAALSCRARGEAVAGGPAEILTQLAQGRGPAWELRGRGAARRGGGVEAGDSAAAKVRIGLERGRLSAPGGDPERALPLFESAFALALEADEGFLAGDAAHMAALAAQDARVPWRGAGGIALAESSEDALLARPAAQQPRLGHCRPASAPTRSPRSSARSSRGRQSREPGADRARPLRGRQGTQGTRPVRRGGPAPRAGRRVGGERRQPRRLVPRGARARVRGARPDGEAAEQARLALPLLEEADPGFGEDGERASRHDIADADVVEIRRAARAGRRAGRTANVCSTGSLEARSTPASRRRSSGYPDPPARRKSR